MDRDTHMAVDPIDDVRPDEMNDVLGYLLVANAIAVIIATLIAMWLFPGVGLLEQAYVGLLAGSLLVWGGLLVAMLGMEAMKFARWVLRLYRGVRGRLFAKTSPTETTTLALEH